MAKKTYVVKKVVPITKIHDIPEGSSFQFDETKFLYDYEKVKTFQRSTKCICCGLEASEMRLEYIRNCRHNVYGKVHLNLYGYTPKGRPIMLTVDHAVLKSLGGADATENYNTMCETCNKRRGNKYANLQDFIDVYDYMSTEEYWEKVEANRAAAREAKLQKNLAKSIKYKERIKKFYAEDSMHHHVGLYNRHMKALYKEEQNKLTEKN